MSRFMRWILVLGLLVAALFYGASELGGEVVELETYDERDRRYATSLWIVDLHGDAWLRAGDPASGWVQRLQINPEVFLTREGVRTPVRAEIVEDYREALNEAMAEKYGRADALISSVQGMDDAVAIRIVSR